MFSAILLLAASAVGVQYGYEPLPEGGMKYILQFDPVSLEEAQKQGMDIESNIPAEVGDVRTVVVRLGMGEPPRELPPTKPDLRFPDADGHNDKSPSASPPPLTFPTQNEHPKTEKPATETKTAETPVADLSKPWPLIGVSIALFASLGGNLYLGWIFAELRKRHRALLENQT